MTDAVVGKYQLLGLRLGRLVPGYVDCWIGDPQAARRVAEEPRPRPEELRRQAGDLLAAVPDSDLAPERQQFLTAQLGAMAHAAGRLAGEKASLLAEIEQCFDV